MEFSIRNNYEWSSFFANHIDIDPKDNFHLLNFLLESMIIQYHWNHSTAKRIGLCPLYFMNKPQNLSSKFRHGSSTPTTYSIKCDVSEKYIKLCSSPKGWKIRIICIAWSRSDFASRCIYIPFPQMLLDIYLKKEQKIPTPSIPHDGYPKVVQ